MSRTFDHLNLLAEAPSVLVLQLQLHCLPDWLYQSHRFQAPRLDPAFSARLGPLPSRETRRAPLAPQARTATKWVLGAVLRLRLATMLQRLGPPPFWPVPLGNSRTRRVSQVASNARLGPTPIRLARLCACRAQRELHSLRAALPPVAFAVLVLLPPRAATPSACRAQRARRSPTPRPEVATPATPASTPLL